MAVSANAPAVSSDLRRILHRDYGGFGGRGVN